MKVGPRVSTEVNVPLDATRAHEAKRAEQPGVETSATARVPVGDRVELSHAARTLADATSLSNEQVDAIRTRISNGAYDDPRVIDVVARRILARGDV